MTIYYCIFVLLHLNLSLQNVYEVKLTREVLDYEIDPSQIISPSTIKACPKQFSKYNKTLISQQCFQKDLSFTTSILIGDVARSAKTHQILNLSIDLHSPWTYFVTSQCLYCDFKNKVPNYDDSYFQLLQKFKNCKENCFDPQEQKNLNIYNPSDIQINTTKSHGIIQQYGESMLGQFFYEKIMLMVYNEDKQLSFKEFVKSKLAKNKRAQLDDILQIKRMKLFGVQSIMSDRKFHGALGMGYIDEDDDDENIQPDTNLVDRLLSQSYDSNNIFGLYLGMVYEAIPDLVMTMGGFNVKYSHNNNSEVNYYKLSEKRQQHWALDVEYLKIGLQSTNMKQLNFTQTQAVLSTSASYIGIPLSQIQNFLDFLNSLEEANCFIVDKLYNQVYCKNMKKYHFIRFQYELKFVNEPYTVQLDSFGMFKYCKSETQELVSELDFYFRGEDEIFECVLNVRVSTENKLILGEPFFKQHYIIFDQDNGKIGLLPATRDQFWIDQFSQGWFLQIMNWLILIFVLGILNICCFKNISKLIKRIKKYIQQRKFKSDLVEIQKLTDLKNIQDDTFYNQESEGRSEE